MALTSGAGLVALAGIGIGIATAQNDADIAPPPTTPPDSPQAYAEAAVTAWQHGGNATVITLTQPAAGQLLLARAPGDDAWSKEPVCEGAAGSTYCTWSAPESTLTIRVANETASSGAPHAIGEALFAPPADGVAIWPFVTQEAADNTQASVDDGHSPWMTDPATVATFYAQAEFGWEQPVVEAGIAPGVFQVSDSATGVLVDLTLAQPSRTGDGGIWAVVTAGSTHGFQAPPERVQVTAPIESVAVVAGPDGGFVAEIVAGLPNGCAQPGGYAITRDGTLVSIAVTNTMPPGDPICTAIYRSYELSVDLGADFTPGETYMVDVNGVKATFTA